MRSIHLLRCPIILLLVLMGRNTISSPVDTILPVQQFGLGIIRSNIFYSPDGKYLFFGSGNAGLKVDSKTGEIVRRFAKQSTTANFAGLALSPDGTKLFTVHSSLYSYCEGNLWNTESGECLKTYNWKIYSIHAITFAPDGKTVITDWENHAALWDLGTGEMIREFEASVSPTSFINDLAFSPDGKTVLFCGDTIAGLWNVNSGEVIMTFKGHTNVVSSVSFSPDGKSVLTGAHDNNARLWNVETGECITIFSGHSQGVYHVAISPDNKTVVTASSDRTARLWNKETGNCIQTFGGYSKFAENAFFSPDGETILTLSTEGTFTQWNSATGDCVRIIDTHNGSVHVAFSPDANMVISGGGRIVRFWHSSGSIIKTLNINGGTIEALACSHDGTMLLTGTGIYSDFLPRLWSFPGGDSLRSFTGHIQGISVAAFSPDNRFVATGSYGDTTLIWNTASGEIVKVIPLSRTHMNSVVFTNDGSAVLTGGWDSTARLWKIESGELIQTFSGHSQSVNSVAVSPDGKTVLTCSSDSTTILWDITNGEKLETVREPSGAISIVRFSPDGKTFLTGLYDNTIKIWSISTHTCVAVLQGHTGYVVSATYSFDSKKIISGSYDHTALLWDISKISLDFSRPVSKRNITGSPVLKVTRSMLTIFNPQSSARPLAVNIYNASGRLILTVTYLQLRHGVTTTRLDRSLATGLYLYCVKEIETNEPSWYGKMLVR